MQLGVFTANSPFIPPVSCSGENALVPCADSRDHPKNAYSGEMPLYVASDCARKHLEVM